MRCCRSGEKQNKIHFSPQPINKGSVINVLLPWTRHLSAESGHNVSGQYQEGLQRKHRVTAFVTEGLSIKFEQRAPPPH